MPEIIILALLILISVSTLVLTIRLAQQHKHHWVLCYVSGFVAAISATLTGVFLVTSSFGYAL